MKIEPDMIRNVAIIAHVDHGKTSLVDKMLYQSGMFRNAELDKLAGGQHGLIMDTDPLERERGITILSKNCAIWYEAADGKTYKINIIDTPGHSDFGGEVERVLKMADGVMLLVDAFEGPMPQTRFVLTKALEHNLKPIIVINKVDRPDCRPHDVVDEVFDLLVQLNASDDALDFPIIFASAKEGWATEDLDRPNDDVKPILESIVTHIPAPAAKPNEPLQMLVTSLEYSNYVGQITIGRVFSGSVSQAQNVTVIDRDQTHTQQKISQLYEFSGLGKQEADIIYAGDICAIAGLSSIDIGDTIACSEKPSALPTITIDEPTIHMTFMINNGPFVGKDGKFVTAMQVGQRLEKELQHNVALKVSPGATGRSFEVSGRGLMHLGILLENMRREGFELCVGKPKVIYHTVDGKKQEPFELLTIDCPPVCQGSVMSLLTSRRGEVIKMENKSGVENFIHIEFSIPSRGLFGMHSKMLTATQGRAIMHHSFDEYKPATGVIPHRQAGVMINTVSGTVTAYALDNLYNRGNFFVSPGDVVYEGQIVGEHCKDKDIPVNVTRNKQLTNMRSSGRDDTARIKPAIEMSLESSLEYIEDDELVEICPSSIRLRKIFLKEVDRKRSDRQRGK